MKRNILAFAVFALICAFGSAERFWHFKSGARDLNGKVFGRISVTNKTNAEIDVSNEPLEKDGKGLYFEESIVISTKGEDCDDYDAIYSIDDKHLQIVICAHGGYDLGEAKKQIMPPMRFAHKNPPPRHRRRYDHGHAPKKTEPRHVHPRRPDNAPEQNEIKPDSPPENQHKPHLENPNRQKKGKNRR